MTHATRVSALPATPHSCSHSSQKDARSLGSYDEREAHIQRALDVAPNDPETIMAAANHASRSGRIRDVLAYGEQARALEPMFPVAGFYCVTMMDMDGRAGREVRVLIGQSAL